jgi:hypothetical protein
MPVAPRGFAPIPLQRPDGGLALVRAGAVSTVLLLDDDVAAYDLAGRPYVLTRDGCSWRRSLDGHWLEKGVSGERCIRRRCEAGAGAPLVESARLHVLELLEALPGGTERAPGGMVELRRRLEGIAAFDVPALGRDAERFRGIYSPIGILPPDEYLALVIQVTEGCPWNDCAFCDLYRQAPFRVKSVSQLEAHIEDVCAYMGAALSMRRSVFLGSANALGVRHERLLPLIECAARSFAVAPPTVPPSARSAWLSESPRRVLGFSAFGDAWTGQGKSVDELRAYAALGLRRVALGLETGDPELLAWLGKAGSPQDAVTLVRRLHAAGIAVGVIVLLGAGGERFYESHAGRTAAVLGQMGLDVRDVVYFSEIVSHSELPYARRMAADGLAPLSPARLRAQRQAIAAAVESAPQRSRPRCSSYDIREFVY